MLQFLYSCNNTNTVSEVESSNNNYARNLESAQKFMKLHEMEDLESQIAMLSDDLIHEPPRYGAELQDKDGFINDVKGYQDNFENMKKFAESNNFPFPYLLDKNQEVAKKFDAVCTPDFFGYNKNLELQYRGRFRELKDLKPINNGDSDLKIAMKMVAQTQKGPDEQIPSMGCNIKWFN